MSGSKSAQRQPGDRDILVKVMACGLCGSDLLEWYRIKRAPLVLGHEPAGVVVETGKLVRSVKPGDRVFVTHHVPCNSCHHCLTGHETACTTFQTVNNFDPGGFSQLLRVTGRSVETGTFKLPESDEFRAGDLHRTPGNGGQGAPDGGTETRPERFRSGERRCRPAPHQAGPGHGRGNHHRDRCKPLPSGEGA